MEASHQSLAQTIERHKLWVNDLTCEAHGRKLCKAVKIHNALNLKNMNIKIVTPRDGIAGE